MIKSIIKHILFLFVRVFNLLFSYDLYLKITGIRNILYTEWIKKSLNKIGKDSLIMAPCSIEGGGG